MLYEIIFSDEATRQLQKLEKEIQKRIITTLERIRIRPEAYLKRLVGYQAYRLRVGDYRVIIDLDQNKLMILVIKIGHRKNIYE
ncbi:type II toxin-antitoxin system RelE/ParE family toxin [Candidatus Woesearchaeota archaeon]|nr:type II toxin-antitoxin system RelE/ParE family toxin [Candidatus Woesearchaeota archaeon]